jgi:putative transposase
MPWSETNAMEQRIQFIRDWLTRRHAVSELCVRYGVSRKTGYKWIERYMADGPDGLLDRSHQAQLVHNKTAPQVEQALLALRQRHPSWGAKKLLHVLAQREPALALPGRSTVCDILNRNGLVPKKPRRRAVGHPGRPSSQIVLPNDCWSADFKGQFRTGDGIYCYPLTVTDNYSRYLLCCQALGGTTHDASKVVFTRLFKEFGLPRRIRTDNGVPFAAATLARLSRLSVWWIKLGVMPELIEPGKPQQNGRHERMHRTLKAETTKPPAASSRAQQRRFDAFRHEFNDERPHEALDMRAPAQLYRASNRPMPDKPLEPEYPDRFEVRYVSANGGIRWRKQWVNVTGALVGEHVGLEEVDDGQWDVYFGPLKLGRLHERLLRIEDHLGRIKRRPS